MRFRKLMFNRVRGEDGCTIKLRVFRGFCEYREGDHVAIVPVDRSSGSRWCGSTPMRVVWKEPFAREALDEERRARIVTRVAEALQFRKCRIEMVTGRLRGQGKRISKMTGQICEAYFTQPGSGHEFAAP
jgi:hypothetical protein